METKHTKGNWHVSHSPSNKNKLTLRWYKSIKNKINIGGKIVANAFGDTKEEAEANAKLIAAAPELLELLMETTTVLSPEFKSLADRIESAIKKTTE